MPMYSQQQVTYRIKGVSDPVIRNFIKFVKHALGGSNSPFAMTDSEGFYIVQHTASFETSTSHALARARAVLQIFARDEKINFSDIEYSVALGDISISGHDNLLGNGHLQFTKPKAPEKIKSFQFGSDIVFPRHVTKVTWVQLGLSDAGIQVTLSHPRLVTREVWPLNGGPFALFFFTCRIVAIQKIVED